MHHRHTVTAKAPSPKLFPLFQRPKAFIPPSPEPSHPGTWAYMGQGRAKRNQRPPSRGRENETSYFWPQKVTRSEAIRSGAAKEQANNAAA